MIAEGLYIPGYSENEAHTTSQSSLLLRDEC